MNMELLLLRWYYVGNENIVKAGIRMSLKSIPYSKRQVEERPWLANLIVNCTKRAYLLLSNQPLHFSIDYTFNTGNAVFHDIYGILPRISPSLPIPETLYLPSIPLHNSCAGLLLIFHNKLGWPTFSLMGLFLSLCLTHISLGCWTIQWVRNVIIELMLPVQMLLLWIFQAWLLHMAIQTYRT